MSLKTPVMALIDLANPTRFLSLVARLLPWFAAATAVAFAIGLYQVWFVAPDDYQQGATVKIMFIHVPNAHTDGDVMVFFRKSDVLVAGDAFNTLTFPVVDMEDGGSLNGVVRTLNQILDITVPEDKQEGGTYVIPGHGRLTDEADVVEYRDMMTIIRDRIQNAIKKGMTLEQVKAARLVRDYEGRYGAARGAATADALVETAYRSLKQDLK